MTNIYFIISNGALVMQYDYTHVYMVKKLKYRVYEEYKLL